MLGSAQLKQLFGFCGTVTKCELVGSQQQLAMVEYTTPAEASAGLAMHGMTVVDRALVVELAATARDAAAAGPVNPFAALQMQQMHQARCNLKMLCGRPATSVCIYACSQGTFRTLNCAEDVQQGRPLLCLNAAESLFGRCTVSHCCAWQLRLSALGPWALFHFASRCCRTSLQPCGQRWNVASLPVVRCMSATGYDHGCPIVCFTENPCLACRVCEVC